MIEYLIAKFGKAVRTNISYIYNSTTPETATKASQLEKNHKPNPAKGDFWVGRDRLEKNPYYIASEGFMTLARNCVHYTGF